MLVAAVGILTAGMGGAEIVEKPSRSSRPLLLCTVKFCCAFGGDVKPPIPVDVGVAEGLFVALGLALKKLPPDCVFVGGVTIGLVATAR